MKFNSCCGSCTPGELQEVLIEALKSESDGAAWWEFLDIVFSSAAEQVWWDSANAQRRANWLLDELRNCRDIIPKDICMSVGIPCGSTYATLARALKAELRAFESDSTSDAVSPRPNEPCMGQDDHLHKTKNHISPQPDPN